MKKKNKGAFAIDTEILSYYLLALAIAAIILTGYLIAKNKNLNALEYIKNLLRFRG